MSIVARILLMIAMTLLLVGGGEVFNGLNLRKARIQEMRSDSVEVARIAELDMARILEGTRQILATLSKLPDNRNWDTRACSVVEATASNDFEYDHIVAVDRDGVILCSSSGTSRNGAVMPDRELLDRVVETNGFVVGAYGRGRLSGNEVIRVGYPVADAAGAVIGAVYAGINVTWLNTAIDQWKLGENATIDIADHNGILVASYPNPRGVGRPIRDSLKAYVHAASEGAAEVTEVNGIARVYGYIPIASTPSDSLAVFVGRDRAAIISGVNRSIWWNVTVVVIALLLSALFAVTYVRRFLAQPFRKLLSAAERWREGDWSARAEARSGIPEFDHLALAFDSMADAVSATHEQVSRMARYDVLTGLANRAVFVEALQHAIAETRRGHNTFAVLYLDLDHFKDVNDTLGHPIGDLLLQSVAERLRGGVRGMDIVARFGGDEFGVLETDLREPGDAAILADKLLKAVTEPFVIQGNEIRIGASIGVAIYGPESFNAEALLSHADVALYRAKSEGRGTYRYFTDAMDIEVRTRVALAAELRTAIESGQLFLVYQPQVDLQGGGIVGVEALVRWRHPTHGIVSPARFIPVAEKSGSIVALGHWVMREACQQMKKWLDAGIAPPLIAVNVSALQFKTPLELERNTEAILMETGVPPQRLELELTESVLMDASREHNGVLVRLRKIGLRIAIDDFGTGYSSLDYLRRFPVDHIKIAQQFIADSPDAHGSAEVVKAAITLARGLKLRVIVEGVETAEQLARVKSWGGREVQGYYFSKPVLAEEMGALLRKGRIVPERHAVLVEAARQSSAFDTDARLDRVHDCLATDLTR